MSIILARIDDRFIHGQVTVGWCPALRPDRIVLCNDTIAGDQWQRRIYASSVPPKYEVRILSRAETRDLLCKPDPDRVAPRTLLLVESPAEILGLSRCGVVLPEINVGGMHHSRGKKKLMEYVYVDQDDVADFRSLLATGAKLKAQTVPGAPGRLIGAEMLDSVAETL